MEKQVVIQENKNCKVKKTQIQRTFKFLERYDYWISGGRSKRVIDNKDY